MPHLKLQRALEKRFPHVRITKAGIVAEDGTVNIRGYMNNLSSKPPFEITHVGLGKSFFVLVRAPDTKDGEATLRMFNNAFGAGSSKPMLVHTGVNQRRQMDRACEFWSPDFDENLPRRREAELKKLKRTIVKRNY